jgi:hypothetical protein
MQKTVKKEKGYRISRGPMLRRTPYRGFWDKHIYYGLIPNMFLFEFSTSFFSLVFWLIFFQISKIQNFTIFNNLNILKSLFEFYNFI